MCCRMAILIFYTKFYITRQKMSPTSVSGGVHLNRREHISRLVERPRGGFAYGKSGTMAL